MKQSTVVAKTGGKKKKKQTSLEIITNFMYRKAKRNINSPRLKKHQIWRLATKQAAARDCALTAPLPMCSESWRQAVWDVTGFGVCMWALKLFWNKHFPEVIK